jgi:putative transposase
MKASRFSEEQIIAVLRKHEAGAKTAEVCRRHEISDATFYIYGLLPRGKKVSGSVLASSIANIYPVSPFSGAPKWEIRSHSPRQMVGLEGHYRRQDLSVPVRSVSPFSDPSSNLA